jgi:hypothetical protein
MAARGAQGFLITTPTRVSSPAMRKGSFEMKAIVMLAAVLTSALLTVPTTSVADAKVSELRLTA